MFPGAKKNSFRGRNFGEKKSLPGCKNFRRFFENLKWKKHGSHSNFETSLRITGPCYRGVWMCIAGVWDLQTTSFEIPWFLGLKQMSSRCFCLQIFNPFSTEKWWILLFCCTWKPLFSFEVLLMVQKSGDHQLIWKKSSIICEVCWISKNHQQPEHFNDWTLPSKVSIQWNESLGFKEKSFKIAAGHSLDYFWIVGEFNQPICKI